MKNAEETKETIIHHASRDIIMHHLGSFRDNDLEAVMSDYTNQSVLITRDATYEGPEEIRDFFTGLMIHFPKGKVSFELDKLVVNNELAYIVWHANTPSVDVALGSDTFIIKNGKIYQQTFIGQLTFMEK